MLDNLSLTTYATSTSTLIRLYKSYIRSLFDYGAPATCVSSTAIQLSKERIQTHFILRALSIPSFIHKDRKRQHAYLPPIHGRNLYLAKRWYRRAMQQNRGVQDYIDNHTHDNRNIRFSRDTPLELIRNKSSSRQATRKCKCQIKTMTISTFGRRSLRLAYEKIPLSSFYIGNPKNCKHKKYKKNVKNK